MRRALAIGFVLLLIPTYIGAVQALPMAVRSTCATAGPGATVTDRVGFCERIGFSVQRTYYLGLLRLPVYPAGLNLDLVNGIFLPVLLGIAGLLWWRGREGERRGERPAGHAGSADEGKREREDGSPEQMRVAVRDA